MVVPAEKAHYTFADYLAWGEAERIELLNGEPRPMSAPGRVHQEASAELTRQLANFLEGKQCRVYAAPFSVRLFEKEGEEPGDVQTVVEPDISVICDRNKLDDYGCKGAPDLVMEILSPSSLRHDRLVKLNLYQKAGVKEYWIVDPMNQSVQVLMLNNGLLLPQEDYNRNDIAKVNVLSGCFIELCKVFTE